MPQAQNIILNLMTEKGLFVLKHMLQNHKGLIRHVVVGEDPYVQDDFSQKIIIECRSQDVDCFFRQSAPEVNENDLQFCVSWRWLMEDFKNVIVFHDSLLPKYRGFSPLVNMLINGESQIGVTALFAAEKYDCGPIIAQSSCSIDYPITISEAINRIKHNYAMLIDKLVGQLKSGSLSGCMQDESGASYSIWRDSDDYFIDWNLPSQNIRRFIDAVGAPYDGALSYASDGNLYRITDAEEIDDIICEIRHAGKVVFFDGSSPVIICGSGLLKLNKYEIMNTSDHKSSNGHIKMRTRLLSGCYGCN